MLFVYIKLTVNKSLLCIYETQCDTHPGTTGWTQFSKNSVTIRIGCVDLKCGNILLSI